MSGAAFSGLGKWLAVLASTTCRMGAATATAVLSPTRAYPIYRRWAEINARRLGLDVRVDDRSGLGDGRVSGAVLFVHLNQQTLLSTMLYAFSLRPCPLVVNFEFAALPFIGWFSVASRSAIIVRQRPSQAKRALERVAARMRAGESFGISIEGQRTRDGTLSPFKKGPVVLAIEAQCDIVPFMTHGEYRLWPRGEWRIRPGRIDCVLYPAISTRGLTYADRDRIVGQLRALAEEEVRRYDGGYG